MKYILLGALLLSAITLHAQSSDEQAVIDVIETFFESLEKLDSNLYKQTLELDGQVWSTNHLKDTVRYRHRHFGEDMRMFERKDMKLFEKALSYDVKVQTDLAMAWVPYEFYLNDEFSHCGVDIFTLMKKDGEWKIILAAYTVEPALNFNVEYYGKLRDIMHKGDISAKADLKQLEGRENLYALGAVEDLKGEILIMDGRPFISSVQGGKLVTDGSFDHKAALLVFSSMKDRTVFEIPSGIQTYEELERFIEASAVEHGIDTEQPFPFLVKGKPAAFDWHVIDWPEGDTDHSHQKHVESGLHGTKENIEVEILGFYSKHHHAIFTHHTTNMHLHVRSMDNKLSGHLDGIVLGKGMTLELPTLTR